MDELDLALLEAEEVSDSPRIQGIFTNYDVDQTLAGFRSAALVKANGAGRLVGIDPTLQDLFNIVHAVTGEWSTSLSPEQDLEVERRVQAAKNDAIVSAMTSSKNGIVVIGASHTRQGTDAGEIDVEPIESLFEGKGVRVIVVEPNTVAWNYSSAS